MVSIPGRKIVLYAFRERAPRLKIIKVVLSIGQKAPARTTRTYALDYARKEILVQIPAHFEDRRLWDL